MSKNQQSIVTNERCEDLMGRYPDKFFDLAIIDPPYGIGEDGSKNKTRGVLAKSKNYKAFAGNDKEAPDIFYFNELFRVPLVVQAALFADMQDDTWKKVLFEPDKLKLIGFID